jgi:hypothetical protein
VQRELDPELPTFHVSALEGYADETNFTDRVVAAIVWAFTTLATQLAAVGYAM